MGFCHLVLHHVTLKLVLKDTVSGNLLRGSVNNGTPSYPPHNRFSRNFRDGLEHAAEIDHHFWPLGKRECEQQTSKRSDPDTGLPPSTEASTSERAPRPFAAEAQHSRNGNG